jgi:O-acetyl-ADP-ribose deacetylase (regulator of RNase III)
MISYKTGDILNSKAEALVNTVNTEGVMGKGIALQFKNNFPHNYKIYRQACKNAEVKIGRLLVTCDTSINTGEKIIINFPTKTTWRRPSQYEYIEKGLLELKQVIHDHKLKSIAIPPLGAGNGGLIWEIVRMMIERYLANLAIEIEIYEPSGKIREKLKKERVQLTESRAMLLFLLYDQIRNGEYVSEFSSEKVTYFLQRFGAESYFKLRFNPNFYGPYSGKVRFILNKLNGSYLTGLNDMDLKPFDPILLIADGYDEVETFIHKDPSLRAITTKTMAFLSGYYSDYALELLSSIDFLMINEGINDRDRIAERLNEWSARKGSLFSEMGYIEKAVAHLQKHLF